MNYTQLLQDSLSASNDHTPEVVTKHELAADIFGFSAYDGEMDELFVTKALEVCNAISNNTTFEYIKDAENYKWYLIMVHMPFFSENIEWGGSIRGAWWDSYSGIHFESICWAWNGDDQLGEIKFSASEWLEFLSALDEFVNSEVRDDAA